MNLLEKRGALQLLVAVAENSRVGRAVVEPAPGRIHDGDHVGGVLADQAEKLFAFHQLMSNPIDLDLLIDRVDVEEQHQADEAANSQAQVQLVEVARRTRAAWES